MLKTLRNIKQGYESFRKKYILEDASLMRRLAEQGQHPEIMVVSCCDSRVDPALLLQCDPGDLFVIRNVANIVPPFEGDEAHHGTSAALEFGICYLNIKHLIILGHSQCGGVHALLNRQDLKQDDFLSNWLSLIKMEAHPVTDLDVYAKEALTISYQNCLTFPWLKKKIAEQTLMIHLWFFEIKEGIIYAYNMDTGAFAPLT